MNGITYGEENNLQQSKHIRISWATVQLFHISTGSGNHPFKRRTNFFFWLLLHDRLNTRNLLKRKNFHLQAYSCVMLDCNLEEDISHLFMECPFAARCRDFIFSLRVSHS